MLAAAGALLGAAAACTSPVAGPRLEPGRASVETFLVDIRATHTGLALADAGGRYVMWGFGDRDYMARGEEGVLRSVWLGIPLVFTKGALERRALAATTADGIRTELGARRVFSLEVGEERAAGLLARLEVAFAEGAAIGPHDGGRDFAASERRYNLWGLFGADNCNGAVADWLRELGCRVPWRWPRWRIWTKRVSRPSRGCRRRRWSRP